MVGTLVVVLPIQHRGGALALEAGTRRTTLLAGEQIESGVLSWAAFHGDVVHQVLPVRDGVRTGRCSR